MTNQGISQMLIIENDNISYNNQFRTSIKVTIEPSKKVVRNNWGNWLHDIHNIKVNGASWFNKKDVLSAKGIKIPAISDKKFDLYAKVIDLEEGSQLYISASFGYDIHITPETFPKEYRALEKFTLDFLTDFLTNYYRNLTENLEEVKSDLEKNKNILQKDLSDNKNDIIERKEENIDLEN